MKRQHLLALPLLLWSATAHAEEAADGLKAYGFVLANGVGNLDGVNNVDVPLWSTGDQPFAVGGTARQSRLGLNAIHTVHAAPDGARHLWAEAKLELDFFGGFPNQGAAESFPLPRLRIATATAATPCWRVTAGQDWVVFAPLSPDTLSHQAIPGFAAAGNLWARHVQLQAATLLDLGGAKLDVKAAVLAPVDIETPGQSYAFGNTLGPGERSGIPAVEGRVGVSVPLGGKPASVGVSGHFGREEYILAAGSEAKVDVFGVALDLSLDVGPVRLAGEAFYGRDLGMFMGGILQGVAKVQPGGAASPLAVDGVESWGGWVQVLVTLPASFRVGLGAGVDNPDDEDLQIGNNMRTLNQAAFLTLFHRMGPMEVALEGEGFRTRTMDAADAFTTLAVNLSAIYRF